MIGDLISGVGGTAWTVVFFIVALSVIVAVHEYGHYIVGRWTGIHAEVFSLGFGPVLFSRTDRRGTRWQIAAIPLGGYVKFLGDSNAASGKDAGAMAGLSAEERRHTMHGAPLWARAATVAAGPVFNFLLTLVIFSGLSAWQGVVTGEATVGELRPYPMPAASLQAGDRIVAVNGTEVADLEAFLALSRTLPPAATVTYRVERAGQVTEVQGPHPMPPLVLGVTLKSAAMRSTVRAGDVIVSANGQKVTAFDELPPIVEASQGAPVDLVVMRDGVETSVTLTPQRNDFPLEEGGFETRWIIGLQGGLFFIPELRWATPFEAATMGLDQSWFTLKITLSGLWHVVTGGISTCNISGPIGMAEVMGDAARSGPEVFLSMLAALSLGIGLLNLFPIPVLDGGHLMFHVWESVTGKPPSDRALGVLMTAGLALVLSFMAFALTNDLFC